MLTSFHNRARVTLSSFTLAKNKENYKVKGQLLYQVSCQKLILYPFSNILDMPIAKKLCTDIISFQKG
jgi:hypothetical protein